MSAIAVVLDVDGTLVDIVAGAGFEPAKDEPRGLQPRPFDRSGTPPSRDGVYRRDG